MVLKINTIDAALAKETFYYDETSPTCLRWKVEKRGGKNYNVVKAKKDSPAGRLNDQGYYVVYFNNKITRVHRLIYSIVNNIEIDNCLVIDHINGLRSDNRIINLRPVTISINQKNRHKIQKNNSSGINGVYWDDFGSRWRCGWVDDDGTEHRFSFTPHVLYPGLPLEEAKQRAFEDAVSSRLHVEDNRNGYLTTANKRVIESTVAYNQFV